MTTDALPGAGLRHDYEHSALTRNELAEKYQTTVKAITAQRVAEQWTARGNTTAALRAYAAQQMVRRLEADFGRADLTANSTSASAAKPAVTHSGGTLPHRRVLIRRLYDVVDAKLGEVETRIMTKAKLTGTDADRETREVGALIKTFEKLTELSDAPTKTTTRSATAASATTAANPDDSPDDTERLRQDLVERFARLRQHTVAGPTVSQPVPS
jgi:hypothetical protein